MLRWLTLVLTALLTLAAVPVGVMLVLAPDGRLLSAQAAWIEGLPFHTYLLPGLALAGLVGGGAILAGVLAARRSPSAPLATALCGTILLVWMTVQLATVRVASPLQPLTIGLAVVLIFLGASGSGRALLWLRWVAANALGEVVGLGLVALGAWLAAPGPLLAPVMIVLGGVEGLLVGAAQARVLARANPALRAGAWIRATVLGALVGWTLGMLPSLLLQGGGEAAAEPPRALQLLLAAGLGAVAGPILAAFQHRELRRRVAHAGWWLPANGVAWAAGMPIVFAAAHQAAGEGQVAAGLALLLAAGAVVGAIHGLALVALTREPLGTTPASSGR